MSDNRPIAYLEDGTYVFRASSLGQPLRCLSAALSGMDALPAPEYLTKAAEAGNVYEEVVKARLKVERNWQIAGAQPELELRVSENAIVRGHLDGQHAIDPDDGEDCILEVKSMSERVFSKFLTHGLEAFPSYQWQISVYMWADAKARGLATPRPAQYAVICRDTAELVTFKLTTPPIDIHTINAKVLTAVDIAEGRAEMPSCEGAPYPCRYSYLCDAGTRTEQIDRAVDDARDDRLRSLVLEHARLTEQRKEIDARQKELKADIEALLEDEEKVTTRDGYKVANVVTTRKSLDKAKLVDRFGPLPDEVFKESTYTTLRITPPSTKE